MPAPTLSDSDFIAMFRAYGAEAMSRQMNMTTRSILRRRRRLEEAHSLSIEPPCKALQERKQSPKARRQVQIEDGIILAGSDFHFWPGMIPTAHAGMLHLAKQHRKSLKAYVWNGDIVDGASISRHARIGWEYRPSFSDELECVKDRSNEVLEVTKGVPKYWMLGNHDARFETRIAADLPQLENLHGVHLKDHFPEWETGWSMFINQHLGSGGLVIKHRFKGGLHAQFNNAIWSGMSMCVGHDHKGIIYPFTDYNGTRFGIGLPVGAEPQGPQFVDYTEDNPLNHRSGFAVFTFRNGRLLQPELAFTVEPGVIDFRGELIEVSM